VLTTKVEGSDLQVCQNLMVLVGQDRRRLSNIFADPAQQNAMDLFRERLAFKLISNQNPFSFKLDLSMSLMRLLLFSLFSVNQIRPGRGKSLSLML
jgi:hypothetical protein